VDGCLFCAIVAGDVPARRVLETERTLAFLDINPATRGHALVVPKAHADDLLDVDPEDLAAVATCAQQVARAAMDTLGAAGINLVQSTREAAFQTVFHLHVHVIPRYHDDGMRLPWTPTPGDEEVLDATAAELADALR
jgi:histidine triad (HIT) family protein